MAAPGDIVNFTFKQKNHTVTQSTFDKPCVKMAGGMDSGFKPNPDGNANPAPTWQYTVMDTKPTCTFMLPTPSHPVAVTLMVWR